MRLSYQTPTWGILAFLWSVHVLGNPGPQAPDTNGTLLISSVFNSNSIPDSQVESDGTLRGSLILHNGRIHTLSGSSPSLVSVLAIKSGRIVYVGNSLSSANRLFDSDPSPPKTVNLRQRTAVPGLIDSHNHIVLLGNRPGYHTPLEYALSISDVQNTIRQRIRNGVPEGKWITTIGGFSPNQFSELRLPTLSELDVAAPNHPVFISTSFAGPATTNSKGRAILTALSWEYGPVNVSSASGAISSGLENGKALLYLRNQLTFDDRTRSVRDAMAYAASVGVTTHVRSYPPVLSPFLTQNMN